MIVEFEELEKLRREKTVCTAGTFDLFHGGHVDFLEYLRKKFPRHKVVVGVLSDKRVEVKKGSDRPIIGQEDRVKVVDAVRFVDYSFIVPLVESGEKSAMFVSLEKIKPNVVVLPDHLEFKDKELERQLQDANIKLEFANVAISNESTTSIINRIKK